MTNKFTAFNNKLRINSIREPPPGWTAPQFRTTAIGFMAGGALHKMIVDSVDPSQEKGTFNSKLRAMYATSDQTIVVIGGCDITLITMLYLEVIYRIHARRNGRGVTTEKLKLVERTLYLAPNFSVFDVISIRKLSFAIRDVIGIHSVYALHNALFILPMCIASCIPSITCIQTYNISHALQSLRVCDGLLYDHRTKALNIYAWKTWLSQFSSQEVMLTGKLFDLGLKTDNPYDPTHVGINDYRQVYYMQDDLPKHETQCVKDYLCALILAAQYCSGEVRLFDQKVLDVPLLSSIYEFVKGHDDEAQLCIDQGREFTCLHMDRSLNRELSWL